MSHDRADAKRPPPPPSGPNSPMAAGSTKPDVTTEYPQPSAEDFLQDALAADSPRQRLQLAKKGLAVKQLDCSTEMLLLRQVYLAHLEMGAPDQALEAIEKALQTGEMEDVCHQDAARALVALGRWDEAANHLRSAARVCPATRRAFHLWTLGSGLFVEGELDDAEEVMRKAMRWATTERPLIAAQLALIRHDLGKKHPPLEDVIGDLESVPAGQGYGAFVLGLLHDRAGHPVKAKRYLQQFIQHTEQGRKATRVSLSRELQLAKRTLSHLP